MEWMLKSDIILERAPRQARNVVGGSWILQEDGDNKTPVLEDDSEWDLDDEKVVDIEEWLKVNGAPVYEFFGFHPYKEIVLLRSHVSVVAYHLNTSKAPALAYAWHILFGCRHHRSHPGPLGQAMFKKSFIVNFPIGLRFKINRLSAD
jgi:hypothetical protein